MCRHFKETNLDPQSFSEYIRLSGEHIRYNTFIVEDNKNIKNVIFTEPTACCLRAVKRIDIKKNDNIMVVGCGTIGIIFISLFKLLYNTKVVAIDINSDKLKYAKKFGADLIINSKKENISERLSEFSSSGVDVVVLTVTTPQTTEMAMDKEFITIHLFM
jgi:L-iditol 2-dehydrogenase